MNVTIRHARASDADAIATFTTDTFEWGDYITDVLPIWLDSDNGCVMVAVDDKDTPVALGRGELMSPTELWLQGARVSEAWRRQGIASAVGAEIIKWGAERGAHVARLLTEGWNEPAQRQVEATGFRRVSSWITATRSISDSQPSTEGNGGQRARARRRLQPAHSSEAVPAWVSWRSGPLVAASRGLYVTGWRWAQLTTDHLITAAKQEKLWSSQAGWVVTRRDGDALYIDWLECGPDDISDMIRSIVDLAVEMRAEYLRIMAPQVDWLAEALERGGLEAHELYIYERAI